MESGERGAERARAFLTELTELSRKHGMVLASCDCCNSMFVVTLDDEELAAPNGRYTSRPSSNTGYPQLLCELVQWEDGCDRRKDKET